MLWNLVTDSDSQFKNNENDCQSGVSHNDPFTTNKMYLAIKNLARIALAVDSVTTVHQQQKPLQLEVL
jgi:hypothetical protein